MHRRVFFIALISMIVVLPLFFVSPAYAHFEHFTHYNNRGEEIGPYYAYEALEPEYAGPGEPVAVMFSVQDNNGHDTYNIYTMVEIYSSITGERLEAWPWTRQQTGDFQVFYTFPEVGNYQIVLSVAKNGESPQNLNGVDPPRATLTSNIGCNCDRAIFNVSITKYLGTIWNAMMLVSLCLPLSVFGGIMIWNYKRVRKKPDYRTSASAQMDTKRYIIMLAAIAGGIVHLAVYAEHASLRMEYSIFLLVAAGMQIVYGIAYTLVTLTGQSISESAYQYYRKKIAISLFGLVGTSILIGLYVYSVILPPPLSPNNQPETIDIAGILAKSIEVFTVIGIVYLMRIEKHQLIVRPKEKREERSEQ